MGTFDPLVFGRRLRHARRRTGLTLDDLGRAIGRPPSYLSQLENGHREPRLSMISQLAEALGCPPGDLLAPEPPSRRAELEVRMAHMQDDPQYRALNLPYLRPSARLDTTALEHLAALYAKVQELSALGALAETASGAVGFPGGPFPPGAQGLPGGQELAAAQGQTGGAGSVSHSTSLLPAPVTEARASNTAMREEMRRRDNYFGEIEEAASRALVAAGYGGPGALSERNLVDVSKYFGFTVVRAQDLPPSVRSISDLRHRVIYVPQRNAAGGMRPSRSVLAQTLGHFALGHSEPADIATYVRQRVESNYFGAALVAPESAAVKVLAEAKARQDISVEDLSEMFYISYEIAAHRLTNLITRHFGVPVHLQRCNAEGVLWKAYENDGVPLPSDEDGTVEGQLLCRRWSSRQAFEAEDAYAMHYQYTETLAGTFWCATHVDLDRNEGDAITVGTQEAFAHWFRGSHTERRAVSTCPDPSCCRRPSPQAAARWGGAAWPSPRDQSHFVHGLPADMVVFTPDPGVELTDVYNFLDRHSP